MSRMDQEQLGELLSAYLDGELDVREAEAVERILKEDASARHLMENLRQTVSVVSSLPRHSAPSGIAEDLQLTVERSELLGGPRESATTKGRRPPLAALGSLAAAV